MNIKHLDHTQLKKLVAEANKLINQKEDEVTNAKSKFGKYYKATIEWYKLNKLFSILIKNDSIIVSLNQSHHEVRIPFNHKLTDPHLNIINQLDILNDLIISMYHASYATFTEITCCNYTCYVTVYDNDNIDIKVGVDIKNAVTQVLVDTNHMSKDIPLISLTNKNYAKLSYECIQNIIKANVKLQFLFVNFDKYYNTLKDLKI